jgi:hypothetical protein
MTPLPCHFTFACHTLPPPSLLLSIFAFAFRHFDYFSRH